MSSEKSNDVLEQQHSPSIGSTDNSTVVDNAGSTKSLMKTRQTIIMSLSASIGTGLWIASARSLYYAGPVGLIIGFFLTGFAVYITCAGVGQMIALKPNRHGMFGYARELGGDALSFTMITNYGLVWFFVYPAEITAAIGLLSTLPNFDAIPQAAWIVILIAITLSSAFLSPRWYGELEFLFGITKIAALVIAAVWIAVCDAGGLASYKPDQSLLWAPDRLLGLNGAATLLPLVSAGFALGGTELFSLACNQARDPRKTSRSNVRAILARVLLCYGATVICFATVIYSGTAKLTNATSPVLEAMSLAHMPALHTTMVILLVVALISAADTSIYLFGRSVAIAAELDYLPAAVGRLVIASPGKARHWPTALLLALASLLAFSTLSADGARAFGTLIDVVAMGNYLTWSGMLLTHVQFLRGLGRRCWGWILADLYTGMLFLFVFAAEAVLSADPLPVPHVDGANDHVQPTGTRRLAGLIATFGLPVFAAFTYTARYVFLRRRRGIRAGLVAGPEVRAVVAGYYQALAEHELEAGKA